MVVNDNQIELECFDDDWKWKYIFELGVRTVTYETINDWSSWTIQCYKMSDRVHWGHKNVLMNASTITFEIVLSIVNEYEMGTSFNSMCMWCMSSLLMNGDKHSAATRKTNDINEMCRDLLNSYSHAVWN